MLSNANNSIQYYSSVCMQLIGFKYCYLFLIILFNVNHLFAHCLNGFKECYFSALDSQLCDKIGLSTYLPQEQFEEYGQ